MPPQRESNAKRWLFTLNNYTEDDEQTYGDFAEEHCEYCIIGKEVGEQGTPHFQGYFVLKAKHRLSWIKSRLGDRVHLEVARGTVTQNVDYCKKEGVFEEWGEQPGEQGNRTDWERFRDWIKEQDHRPTEKEITESFPGIWGRYRTNALALCAMYHPVVDMVGDTPKPWQATLRDQLLEEADDRTVLFVVDPEGNKGKSWFCRWMYCKYPEDVQILGMGKRDDMAHMIDSHKKIFLINVPRGQMEYLSYPVLEMIKDRLVSSPKYDSRVKEMMSKNHVVVFCNEAPDEEKMTSDRYGWFDCTAHYDFPEIEDTEEHAAIAGDPEETE